MLSPGSDTHGDIDRMMIERWRHATPSQKLERMASMAHSVNELARAELRLRYPNATPREIDLRLRSRTLDRQTMMRAFGWDPELHGI